jgi:diguanylate cyclase (GGDEF)-like protein
MTVASRGRTAGAFAARLAGVVLLAATLTAVGEGVLAAHLASQAVLREALASVRNDAGVVAAGNATDDPWTGAGEALDGVSARPDVRAAWLVDDGGTVRRSGAAGAAGATDPGAWDGRTLDADTQAVVDQVIAGATPRIVPPRLYRSGIPAADPRAGGLSVVVPVQVGGRPMVLLEVLDPGPPARRATELRRALLLVIGLGAAGTVPLALALGGRRLAAGYRRAARAAHRDDLTRLGNRRALRADLPDAVAAARRSGRPLSVVLLEVGGLSAVRDETGHRRAEVFLVGVAGVLSRGREGGERAYRIGGDGFAVLMPGTVLDGARDVADQLCHRVAAEIEPLSAVAGVCTLDERCPDAETLLIGADAALLEAKQRTLAAPGRSPVPVAAGDDPLGWEPGDDVWDIRLLTGWGPAGEGVD